ncbi:MAG: hypothetical protein AMXMBFR13_29990 [Phycisphaerae bacterium]|jgi:hypothetical protein
MPADTIDSEVLDTLIDELDLKSENAHCADRTDDYWVCQRRHPRHPFRTTCRVRFFPVGSSAVSCLPGRTRNLSRNGVGLLVRRVFSMEEPIEVEISTPGRPKTFMAGLVRFCRYAGRGYHEIGVLLKAAGNEPIFSKNPSLSMETLDWLKARNEGTQSR